MMGPPSSSMLLTRSDDANEECDLLIAKGRGDPATNTAAFDCADEEWCTNRVDNSDRSNDNVSPTNRRQNSNSNTFRKLLALVATSSQRSKIFTLKHDWIYGQGDYTNPTTGYNYLNSEQVVGDAISKNEKTANRSPSQKPGRSPPPPPGRTWLRGCWLNGNRRPSRCQHYLTLVLLVLSLVGSCLLFYKLLNLISELGSIGDTGDVDLISVSRLEMKERRALDKKAHVYQDTGDRWLVAQSKCHIPNIEAWHESIKDYVKAKPALDCEAVARESGVVNRSLTFVQDNVMYFTPEALQLDAPRMCCHIEVTRPEEGDDKVEYNKTCIPFVAPPMPLLVGFGQPPLQSVLQANADGGWLPLTRLIRVECPLLNYTNVHSFVVHDPEEEEALAKVAEKQLDQDQYYNVVLLGIDTISRLNAIRQLSKTLQVLRDKFGTLEYRAYNKVGENTFPNLIPFLTGLKPEQLTETQCWLASNYSQESETGDDYLDGCKFLWNYYQSLGYVTYFSEDWPKASTFNYLKPGFKRQPTAYYGRPFTLARDPLLLPQVGMGCSSCLRDKPIVGEDLEYLKSFIKEHKYKPYFAFHWINCPQHDDLNGASQVDELIAKFLADIHDITQRNRTFVIVFSDHGYRWEKFVSTRIGHYESSLPLLTIAPPKHFVANHANLYDNMRRHNSLLITPFDMFKTLIKIRDLGLKTSSTKEKSHREERATLGDRAATRARNKELAQANEITFLDNSAARIESTTTFQQLKPVTGLNYKQDFSVVSLLETPDEYLIDRSCIEAGIPDSYCVCHEFKTIDTNRTDVLGATYYLVYVHLYTRVKKHSQICHQLELDKVFSAEVFNFSRMKAAKKSGPKTKRAIGRGHHHDHAKSHMHHTNTSANSRVVRTTSIPRQNDELLTKDERIIDERHYLPNREYNIRFSTKPGGALFQEVVRYYGNDLSMCREAVERVRKAFSTNDLLEPLDRYRHVQQMNGVCKFSVHSDSISRLNLYKDQSQCVTNDIELKKICYCNDLM